MDELHRKREPNNLGDWTKAVPMGIQRSGWDKGTGEDSVVIITLYVTQAAATSNFRSIDNRSRSPNNAVSLLQGKLEMIFKVLMLNLGIKANLTDASQSVSRSCCDLRANPCSEVRW